MGVARRAPFPYGNKAVTHFFHSLHRGRLNLGLNKAGLFEFFDFPGLSALAASGVGGGSLAYGGLLEAPRHPAFWQGCHPELDPASIEGYYAKVIADMGGVLFGRDHLLPQSVWTHFPDSPAGHCRPADPQPHMAMLFPPSAAQAGATITWGPSGVQRQYCAFDGDSFLGSRGGAKASVDFVYLAPVLDKGATVRDLCQVTRIQPCRPVDGAGYHVHFTDLATGTAAVVRAQRVVLAAGTLNTLRLLFASAGQPDGLAAMPALGRRFFANGDLIGLWFKSSAQASSFVSAPSHGTFAVAGHEAPTYGMGGFPGFETWPMPSFVKRKLGQTLFTYGMGSDSGKASVFLKHGHLSSDYDYRQEPIYDDIRGAFGVIAGESGHRILASKKPVSVHAMGGACVGPDAQRGVVDHRGEIHGNPGLFVTDMSTLPMAPGGPPSVATAAWAHHVADGIVRLF
jgi:cholesterol oxidase